MESLDARSFFDDFAKAMYALNNADTSIFDKLNHVGYTKAARSTHTNASTVEIQAIEKALLLDTFTSELENTLEVIKQGFELIGVVSKILGTEYGDILALRYVQGLSLRIIAHIMHISKTSVERKRDIALDWLDATPESYIKNCKGIAEKI